MGTAVLDGRGVVEVEGDDARTLLQRLVTSDVSNLKRGEARYSALLTPQGKIVADFLIHDASPDGGPDRFLLDAPRDQAADLAKRLTLYRLRAAVRIADRSAELGVTAHWPDGAGARDPRHAELGTREIGPRAPSGPDAAAAYEAHRIALGVPDGGRDFPFGETFPHDANLDRLGGVDFEKGCYVGQEVVSRVQHRGTARRRIVPVWFDGASPRLGEEITAAGVAIGTMGTSADGRGLAAIRLDRAGEAASAGMPIRSGEVDLRVELT